MAVKVQFKMLGGFHVFADGVVCDDKICKTRKGSMLLRPLTNPCVQIQAQG